jgi:hypothetical protein
MGVGADRLKQPRSIFTAQEGEACMNNTSHPVRHPRRHLGDRVSAQMRGSSARQKGQSATGWHCVGLERPHFCTRFRAQSESWVAPAQQETSFGVRGENLGEAGEEGRNYVLQLRLHHLLLPVIRISPRKTSK